MLVWPPRSHTWNLMFLYVTVSTLKPIAAEPAKAVKQCTGEYWQAERHVESGNGYGRKQGAHWGS